MRRLLKAFLWTTSILVLLIVFAFFVALFTVDEWIVPVGAWCAGVEVEGEPDVLVSISNREVVLSGLKARTPAGEFEANRFGFRLDGVKTDGLTVKEIHVSGVHVEGLRAELDFARYADARNGQENESSGRPISGEKVRTFSHLIWEMTVVPFRGSCTAPVPAGFRWVSAGELSTLAFPVAMTVPLHLAHSLLSE